MLPTFNFSSLYSSLSFFVSPFGIIIFMLVFDGEAGSQCKNLAFSCWLLAVSSWDMNENVRKDGNPFGKGTNIDPEKLYCC